MKKLLCALIAAVMMLTMICPVMAATVTVDKNNVNQLFDRLANYMPDDPMERIAAWKNFKAYMADDAGIDNIINAVKGTYTIPAANAGGLKAFIDGIQSEESAETKDAFIFILNVYKAVPASKRSTSLNLFGGSGDSVTTEIVMNKLTLNGAQKAAADTIYDAYVPASVQAKFGEHFYVNSVDAALDVENFLLLLTAFNGQFKMTDSGEGDFALNTYNKDFAKRLAANMSVTGVNDVEVSASSTAEAEGFDIITGFVEFFNSFAEIDELKVVLAHPDINLYGPGLSKAERPETSEGGSGSITGGGGAGLPPQKPTEPEQPTVKFPDVVGHWAEDYISDLADRGILTGYEDGNYKPDIGVTRQEVAVIMTRALGLEEKAASAQYAQKDSGFADDDTIAAWGRGAINLMVEMGIYTGYGDNEFKPDRIILRQELIAVVMRYAEQTEEGMQAAYEDDHEIHGYAESFVAHASELGIVNGYPDGTFKPLNSVTRAEAAKIIYGVIEYYKEIGKLN